MFSSSCRLPAAFLRAVGRTPGRASAAACALLLAGCASLSPDGGTGAVQSLVDGNPLLAGTRVAAAPAPGAPPADDAAPTPAPLSQAEAVRQALRHSPRAEQAFATLRISDADRAQAASLPNPVFAFGRLREGSEREFERALGFNVIGLLTLPWQARWAGQRHQAATLAAAQSVLALAADTRRAWLRAVAAQQRVAHLRDALDAAEAGAELARRMAERGNWSALQHQREALVRAEALAQLERGEQEALAAREQLTRLLGLRGAQAGYTLPEQLPALPAEVPDPGDVQALALRQRLDLRAAEAARAATADSLGLTRATRFVDAMELGVVRNATFDGERASRHRSTQRGWVLSLPVPLFDWGQARSARAQAEYMQSVARLRETAALAASESREALARWRRAHALAQRYQREVLPLRRQVNEEMLLRYNGMLASVWELLAEARATSQAVQAAIDAQRDFWLADTDLQLALTGGSPPAVPVGDALSSSSSSSTGAGAGNAGH